MRKKWGKVLLAAFMSVTTIAISACAGAPTDKTIGFQVMSFNIRVQTSDDKGDKNWSARCAPLVEYLEASEADVICLQEVTKEQAADVKEGLSGPYEVVYYERDNTANAEGLAICYTADFELENQSRFWLSETPEEMSKGWGTNYYRICVNLLLRHRETGAYLDVYNVHLDHQSEDARVNGLKLIMERATKKGYPTVVMGDFNSVKDSACYQAISAEMYDCQKESDITDEGVTYHNWGKSIEELNSKTAIDFCFVSKNIEPLEFDIKQDTIAPSTYYSDHYAITSLFRVSYTPIEA